jgi:hypothetical protein
MFSGYNTIRAANPTRSRFCLLPCPPAKCRLGKQSGRKLTSFPGLITSHCESQVGFNCRGDPSYAIFRLQTVLKLFQADRQGRLAHKPVALDPRAPFGGEPADQGGDLARSFVRLSNLPTYPLDRLSRYEATVWRQACQILFTLQCLDRRRPWERLRLLTTRDRGAARRRGTADDIAQRLSLESRMIGPWPYIRTDFPMRLG